MVGSEVQILAFIRKKGDELMYTVPASESESFKKASPAINECFQILIKHNLSHGEAELLCKYLLQRVICSAKEKSLSGN